MPPSTTLWIRWSALAIAAVVAVLFLIAQRQTVQVKYGQSTSTAAADTPDPGVEGFPSDDALAAMVAENKVVRLPGAVAVWDEDLVRRSIGDFDVRIIVAPPGLSKEQSRALSRIPLPNDEYSTDRAERPKLIRIVGTQVSMRPFEAVPNKAIGWRNTLMLGDVTHSMTDLLGNARDEPTTDSTDRVQWREPTPAEIEAVAADLQTPGIHFGADVTPFDRPPANLETAFPDQPARVAVFPRQPLGTPVPNYGAALAKRFPGAPIVVMYGDWVEYHGPESASFTDVAEASFYGTYGQLIAKNSFPTRNVLGVYLGGVTDIRFAGLFDRPLPYTPTDPLRITLPALPWVFGACVLVFLGVSVNSLRRRDNGQAGEGVAARLAGLTSLAVELSGLARSGDAATALTRGIAGLQAAGSAVREELPTGQVRRLMSTAEQDLDEAARSTGRADYRPVRFLRGRLT